MNLITQLTIDPADAMAAANEWFDKQMATMPADIRAQMPESQEKLLRFMFVQGWRYGAGWFAAEVTERTEALLARMVTETFTGGNA